MLLEDFPTNPSMNDDRLLIPAPEDLEALVEMVCASPFTCIRGGLRTNVSLSRERSAARSPFLDVLDGNHPRSVLDYHIPM